jgi:hypothetical protein
MQLGLRLITEAIVALSNTGEVPSPEVVPLQSSPPFTWLGTIHYYSMARADSLSTTSWTNPVPYGISAPMEALGALNASQKGIMLRCRPLRS